MARTPRQTSSHSTRPTTPVAVLHLRETHHPSSGATLGNTLRGQRRAATKALQNATGAPHTPPTGQGGPRSQSANLRPADARLLFNDEADPTNNANNSGHLLDKSCTPVTRAKNADEKERWAGQ